MNMRNIPFPLQLPKRTIFYVLFGVLGGLLLLLAVNDKNWKPLQGKIDWDVHSNYSDFSAYLAVDLNMDTAWSSHVPMEFGMYYQVDVGKPVTMNGLLLRVGKERQGQPVEWVLKTSLDGERWRTHQTGAGIRYKSMLVIPFEAARARYVQLIQTSVSSSPSPWLIYELDVLQPVVPWQFQRGTLLLVILGWAFLLLVVLLFLRRTTLVCSPGFLTLVMLAIILSGWLLRVYDLDSYEFSDHEYQWLSVLTFDKYTHGEWLNQYIHYSKTGAYWLMLLCIRWAYQFSQNQFVALRLVPAMFGIGSVLLLYVVWRRFSRDDTAEWEALSAAALLGWSGWDIFLSRNGSFFAPLLFVTLLYLLAAYHFLYQRGSLFLLLILAVLLCAGLFLHPLTVLAPIGIVLFGVFHLLLCRRSPGFLLGWHILSFSWRHNVRRLVGFFLSTLPGYAYWFLFMKREGLFLPSWENLALSQREFWRAVRFSGTTGPAAWIVGGLVLWGTLSVLFRRDHGEWFFLFLTGGMSGSIALLAPGNASVSASFQGLMMIVLAMKGLQGGISFFCPRLAAKRLRITRLVGIMLVGLYMALFSLNSFAGGRSIFPYASELRADYQAKKTITTLVQAIHNDPDPCKVVLTPNQELAEWYGNNYKLQLRPTTFSELLRLADQGIFSHHLLIKTENATASHDTTQFLHRYYTDIGNSLRVTLYEIKKQFRNTPQRYYARDLFYNTGHHIEDVHASGGVVRFATPADGPGLLSFGPFVRVCEAGRYTARFALRVLGGADDESVVRLEIIPDNFGALASMKLTGTDFPDPERYEIFDLPFDLDFSENPVYPMKRLQFFVHVTGGAEVRLDYLDLIPAHEE